MIIKNFKIRNLVFQAPQCKLKFFPFGAFMFTDTYFQNYLNSGDVEDLNKMVMSFYHLQGEKFDEISIEKYCSLANTIDVNIRRAICLNYSMIKTWLTNVYTYVFLKETNPDKKIIKTSEAGSWIDVYDNLVGDDLINNEKYSNLPTHIVLKYLNKKIREYYKNGGKI